MTESTKWIISDLGATAMFLLNMWTIRSRNRAQKRIAELEPALGKDARSWTEFGYVTPEELQARRLGERLGAVLCGCGHPRREHFPEGCVHSVVRLAGSYQFRVGCDCGGFSGSGADETPRGGVSTPEDAL